MDNSNEKNDGDTIRKQDEISDLEFIRRKQIDVDFEQMKELLDEGFKSM